MQSGWIVAAVVSASLGVWACGGSTDADGSGGSGGSVGGSSGSGGTGGSGATGGIGGSGGSGATGGSGGTGGMPPQCQVSDSSAGPHAVKFQFTNDSATPLFVLGECHVRYEVTSCADDYQSPLPMWADCTIDCASPEARGGGCIACGACMHQGIEVTAGAPYESEWSGKTYEFSTTNNGCSCYTPFSAPAGKYKIAVPVYASDDDAQQGVPLYTIEVPFTLPAAGGVVEVPLAAQADPDSP